MSREFDPIYLRVLVLRCQTGDADALREVVERYGPGVRSFLRKLGVAESEDVEQEVWLEVWRGVCRLREPGAFVGWVYRIARDRAFLQRRRRRVAALDEDVVVCEDKGFSEEELAAVREAVAELPEEQREVVRLRFMEGQSYEEIADRTGKPVGTVRSRLFYAKAALREQLRRGLWKGWSV